MASPTVLMLASSSSGMATPNLSSTAVAISTIDSESTSRSSVNDFSGVASAALTPATSSRISARPDWISCVLLMRGRSLGWGGRRTPSCPPRAGSRRCPGRRRSAGTRCPGNQWVSREDQYLPGERETGAVAEHQREVARLGLTGLHQRGQRQRDGGGRGVAGLHDVTGDGDVVTEAEPLGHRLDDAQAGLVRGEDVDVVRADPGLLHRLLEGGGALGGGPAVDRLAGHRHRRAAGGDLDLVVLVAVAAPGDRAD